MNQVTLMTDFGTQDGYVAAMQGKLLGLAPQTQVIHATHAIEPQNLWQAAMALKRYAQHYPEGTIHMVVVDPGVGSERKALAIRADAHWFIGPNNGVLSLALSQYTDVQAYELENANEHWKKHQSFDGLALFTPAAAYLANGGDISLVAQPLEAIHQLEWPTPEWIRNQIIGQVVGFDRFGNAITNLAEPDFAKTTPTVRCKDLSFPFLDHYCDAPAHGRIALINSDGALELSVYQGSAKDQIQLAVGDTVSVELPTDSPE